MQEVLGQISPGKEERAKFSKIINSFLEKLNPQLKDGKALLGGSGSKDTWLAGSKDADIFVQFDFQKYASKSDQLSEILEKNLRKAFPKLKIERFHGSRDYFQVQYENITFEVIPILKIKKSEEAVNITDISPLHSVWVNKHTINLKSDIRLAKRFCKANGLYGAESYIGGFSGYVLEILIAYYGSFGKLLQASLKWKEKELVDPEKYYPKKDVQYHLNKSKLQSPLIVIDPVDKRRNAAAALGRDKFLQFQKVAKEYLKKPSAKFFEKESRNYESLKQEASKSKLPLLFLEITTLEGKEDVIGAKLMKAFGYLTSELNGFGIKKSSWEWDKNTSAQFYFLLEKDKLPDLEVRSGPPLKLKEFVADFKKKNRNTYEEKGRIMAKVKVENPKLAERIKFLISQEYFKEKIKEVKVL